MPTARESLAAAGVDGRIYAVGGKTGNTCVGLQTLEEYDPVSDAWTSRPPMPSGRWNPAAAELDGELYVVGGDAGCGSRSGANEAYDPITNTWTSKAAMPTPRTSLAAASVDGALYVIGGIDANNLTDVVEAYDPCTNTWTTKAPLPAPLCSMGASAIDGKVYVFGGQQNSGMVNTIEVYDPHTDSWSSGLAVMPTTRHDFAVAPLDARICIVGGYSVATGLPVGAIELYDPAADRWSSGPSIPTPRGYLAAGSAREVLCALGGGPDSNVISGNEAFAPVRGGNWTAKPSMPTARNALAAAGVDGVLYAVGGKTGNTCVGLQTLEGYDPIANSWSTLASMPSGRWSPSAAELDGHLYVVGGDAGCGSRSNANEAYDPRANTWTSRAPLPTARTSLAIAVVDGVLYAFGGVDSSNLTGVVEAFDPCSNTWTTKTPMPAPRCSMMAGAVDGKIYIVGGQDSSGALNSVEVYDPRTDSWSNGLATMPTLRLNFAGDVLNGRVFVVGGYPIPSGSDLGTLEGYDADANAWSTEPSMPTPRRNLAAGVAHGVLYAVGGGDDSNVLATLEAFAPAPSFTSVCEPGTGGVIACPCANPAAGPGRGCDNSAATGGAILWASGVSYLSSDSLVFTTSGEKPTATSILLQGTSVAPAGIAYGQGVRCVNGTLKRLFVKVASGGSITAPNFGAGDPTVSARSAAKGDTIVAGQSRWYLVYYRDPTVLGGCAATKTFNSTQTGQVTWSP